MIEIMFLRHMTSMTSRVEAKEYNIIFYIPSYSHVMVHSCIWLQGLYFELFHTTTTTTLIRQKWSKLILTLPAAPSR